MKKIVEIDILKEEYLYDTYNQKMVSDNLIEYIYKKVGPIRKQDSIVIVINKRIKDKCEILLREGFKKGYEKSIWSHYRDNYLQIVYFLIGFIMLFFSRVINENLILDEILVIGGWVLIWEAISIEIFNNSENRKRRRIMKKLDEAEFIGNYIK